MQISPFLPTGPEAVMSLLQRMGACVFPVMSHASAAKLAVEAEDLVYTIQPQQYGKRGVRQEIASTDIPSHGKLWDIADAVERSLAVFFGDGVFESPLCLNQRNVQRYSNGTIGIEPHKDESENRNLIVLLGLRGRGRFTVYDTLGGPIIARWVITPGDLVLMRAPGFCGADTTARPVHRVDQIVGDPYRYLLGLRQCGVE